MKRSCTGLAAATLAILLSACSTPGNGNAPAVNGVSSAGNNSTLSTATSSAGANKAATANAGTNSPNSSVPASKADASPSTSPTKAEQLLADGTDLYEKGDFKTAIKKLQGARDAFADTSTNMQDSLKYLAFSYCVTGQKALCKAQFVALLKISPEFVLSRAEGGHPLWGPVFKEARASVKIAATTSSSTK